MSEPLKRKAPLQAAALSLPAEKRKPDKDPSKYTGLVYGRGGVGKTTFLSSWPDILFFSTERVSRGLSMYDFNAPYGVTSWKILLEGIKLLEQTPGRFATVGIDTIDAAYAMCLDHVCAELGVDHPADKEWGVGWAAVRREFITALARIMRTGRGLMMTSHAREREITSYTNARYTRIEPTCSGQCYDIVKGITDLTLYGEWFTDRKGNPVRALVTIGDELIDAKNSLELPRFVPLLKDDGFKTMCAISAGTAPGYQDGDFMPGVRTSKPGVKLFQATRRGAAQNAPSA